MTTATDPATKVYTAPFVLKDDDASRRRNPVIASALTREEK